MTAPVDPVIKISDEGNPIAAELFCQLLSRGYAYPRSQSS